MKKIALSMGLLLPFLFFACKKNNDNNGNDTPAPQTRVMFINVGDTSDYTVVGLNLPDVPLLKPGTAKTYTLNMGEGEYSPLFCRQGKADTTYVSLKMKPPVEYVFIMQDNTHAWASYISTTCFDAPSGKAIIRYLNPYTNAKMEIADAANTNVLHTYNNGSLSLWPDAEPQPQTVACNSFAEGDYTLRVYADAAPGQPVAVKTNVHINKNKVYYVYLNSKNEIKMIER